MMENNNQPQAIYTKEGGSSIPPTLPVSPMNSATSSTPLRTQEKKILGLSMKKFGIVAGLLSFLIIGGAILLTTGILEKKESTAPTLPKAAEDLSCSLAFEVIAEPTPTPTPTPSPSPSPTPEPETLTCNSECNPDDDRCDETNSNYYCSVTYGERCRHADYPEQEDCKDEEYVEPTPAPGCNDTCETSSDCANPDHICYETSSGLRCRLDEYPWSSNCVKPGTIVENRKVYTPSVEVVEEVVTTEQPALPEQLPQTGAADIIQFAVGAGTTVLIGLGLLLLL